MPFPPFDLLRNIPAHAGKTAYAFAPIPAPVEHPRARGENSLDFVHAEKPCGTSPRTRGKRLQGGQLVVVAGNIPAHAGKTQPEPNFTHTTGEHPRARGENTGGESTPRIGSGTSPRTRGKRGLEKRGELGRRNIPACAGKTFPDRTGPGRTAEHPRVRGENAGASARLRGNLGTSPRARGKRRQKSFFGVAFGNIPACAGKTCRVDARHVNLPEHPRVRGENHLASL